MTTAPIKSDRFKHLESFSKFLDSSIPLGETGYSIGVDPIIGLLPGIGDALGAVFSIFILVEAAHMGASRFVLFKMVLNIMADTLIGAIPILGDIFDFA